MQTNKGCSEENLVDQRRRVRGSKFSNWIGAQFYLESDGSVTVMAVLREEHGGPPQYAHGGVLAALLDEGMGAAAWHAGHKSVAANLTVNYRHPVPPGIAVQVSARLDRIEGRKAFTSAVLTLPDGTTAAEGAAIFVAVPGLPEDGSFEFGSPLN
jgi:uncharacterized protein (TIGR00369 family)